MNMLPQTKITDPERAVKHESIHDLPVHKATLSQVFWPTTESMPFNRNDAGKVFHKDFLPADLRIPNPEVIENFQDDPTETRARRIELQRKIAKREEDLQKARERRTMVVRTKRFDVEIENVAVDNRVGKDGRGRNAVGYRYGAPLEDRKKGFTRVPKSVG